jgi:hypothetical protein
MNKDHSAVGENGIGIVIKNYQPYKNSVCLIDDINGRIDVTVYKERLMTGSKIGYRLEKQRTGNLILTDIKLHDVPFKLAQHDILFLHHTLELCYYFIPVASGVEGVFDLLQFLYSADIQLWNNATKRLFLLKVLMCIGMYSIGINIEKKIMNQLCSAPLGTPEMADLAMEHAVSVNRWLHACLREHPYIQKFNTIHFLMRE